MRAEDAVVAEAAPEEGEGAGPEAREGLLEGRGEAEDLLGAAHRAGPLVEGLAGARLAFAREREEIAGGVRGGAGGVAEVAEGAEGVEVAGIAAGGFEENVGGLALAAGIGGEVPREGDGGSGLVLGVGRAEALLLRIALGGGGGEPAVDGPGARGRGVVLGGDALVRLRLGGVVVVVVLLGGGRADVLGSLDVRLVWRRVGLAGPGLGPRGLRERRTRGARFGIGIGFRFGIGVGFSIGIGIGFGIGFGVRFGVGGLSFSAGVGVRVGIGVGFSIGVRFGVRFGVGGFSFSAGVGFGVSVRFCFRARSGVGVRFGGGSRFGIGFR
ncbi:MAG: hypothetical protein CMN29_15265 [Sandaracinus sp.]|nr:hypothetical protein [Sandaracinus sp.]